MHNRPEKIGNYRIEHIAGRGSTSEVWLARHAYLEERQVAVKILLSQDVEAVQRFSLEANILSQLSHPNVVQIYDHGYYEPYYYSIIEYISGCSLQSFLDRHRRLDFLDALGVVKQIANALDYAHSLSIIHRDVSPGNVLIEQDTMRVLLTDFGIARDSRQPITVDQKIMGTPGYWSPEHTRSSKEVTHLSDIYGMGVIFYVLLSGDLPWDELPGFQEHPFVKPLPLKQRGITNLPGDVDRIIQTMLAIDPSRRYPRARDAIEELERLSTRHHATTQMTAPSLGNGTAAASIGVPAEQPTDVSFQASGVAPNDVETIFGADLVRAPIAQAHERAGVLCQPAEIAAILNRWSAQGFYHGIFRRSTPGRLARLHQVQSRNVYFYQLQVLYEQRGQPQYVEEPDHEAEEFPLEPEVDLWHIALPSVQEFADDAGGQTTVPGSVRVVQCTRCGGKGKVVCPRCGGKQRIQVTRTVESSAVTPSIASVQGRDQAGRNRQAAYTTQTRTARTGANVSGASAPRYTEEVVLIPCPDCEGRGGTRCDYCEGTGRMVQRKAFRWMRTARIFEDYDDLSTVDERWLFRSCTAHDIYHERYVGSAQSESPAFAPEWSEVSGIQDMLDAAQQATSENARIILSELRIRMIPVTDIVFDLGDGKGEHHPLYHLSIWGFENIIPPDWRLLNWERVVFFWSLTFFLLLVVVMGVFAFLLS